MRTNEGPRRMYGFRMLMAALALLPLCGCFSLTEKVWQDGQVETVPTEVEAVRVSADGDVYITHSVRAAVLRSHWLVGDDEKTYEYRHHALLMRAEHVRGAAQSTDEAPLLVVQERHTEERALPRYAARRHYQSDELFEQTKNWRELKVVSELSWWHFLRSFEQTDDRYRDPDGNEYTWDQLCSLYRRQREQQMRADLESGKAVVMYADPNSRMGYCPQTSASVCVPIQEDRWVVFELPSRSGVEPLSIPVRVALTPPALAGDVVLDVAVKPPLLAALFIMLKGFWRPRGFGGF